MRGRSLNDPMRGGEDGPEREVDAEAWNERCEEARRRAETTLGQAVHPAAIERLYELWPQAHVEVAHWSATSARDHQTPLRITTVTVEPVDWGSEDAPDERIRISEDAKCRMDIDNYDRRFGIDLAFRRALKQIGKHEAHEALMRPARARIAELDAEAEGRG